MRSRAAGAALFAVAAAGVLVLVVTAVGDDRPLAFTLGVRPTLQVAQLESGEQACQAPIDVATEFSAVTVQAHAFGRPGPPLEVSVMDAGGRTISRGRHGGGYTGGSAPVVPVRAVPEGARVAVCVRNAGREQVVTVLGGAPQAARSSAATVEARSVPADLSLVFLRDEPASALSLVPDMFERATLFHPGWAGTWTFWALLVLAGAGVPLALWLGLRAALRESGEVE